MTQQQFTKEIVPILKSELALDNIMAVPKLTKIVVNCGLGEALTDKKVIESMAAQLTVITGQKPQTTRAKRAIATYKLRAGDTIGLKVTLRGKRMYDFLTRLTSIALPRVRDFRGISTEGFDGRGAYTLGINEQSLFPELDYKLIDKPRGFEVTFVTTARDAESTKKLLTYLKMPFEKEE